MQKYALLRNRYITASRMGRATREKPPMNYQYKGDRRRLGRLLSEKIKHKNRVERKNE